MIPLITGGVLFVDIYNNLSLLSATDVVAISFQPVDEYIIDAGLDAVVKDEVLDVTSFTSVPPEP